MSDHETKDLLLCPFCGGKAEYGITGDDEFNHIVSCDYCGATTDAYLTKAAAVAAWNRRQQ